MKTKKAFALMILVVLASSFLVSCGNKVNAVEEIPAGFVKLSTADNNLDNGGLHYTIGQSQITFLDKDENRIYQTELTNSEFIVTYENEYYIKEAKFSELVNRATSVKSVSAVPEGFVQLNAGLNKLKNGLHCVFGEAQILFLDADNICIYQTRLNNSDFIVLYDKRYYINENKFAELTNWANVIAAQRNNIYKRGETVYLRGFESNSYAILLHQTHIGTNSKGKTLCRITFAKSFDGSLMIVFDPETLTQIFDYIETDKGTIIDDFVIDSKDIWVEIPKGEDIKYVAVKSPDYPGCSRKIGNEYVPAKNEVQTKPEGFIKLKDALEELDNGLKVVFWETQVSFVVDGLNCVYQTDAEDSNLLIIYENETYINEQKFLGIVALADAAVGK